MYSAEISVGKVDAIGARGYPSDIHSDLDPSYVRRLKRQNHGSLSKHGSTTEATRCSDKQSFTSSLKLDAL